MALKALPSRLQSLPSRVCSHVDAQGHSELDDWRKWYGLARWKHPKTGLRVRTFIRDAFTCRMCGAFQPDASKLAADHVEPHRGDEDLFWDEANVQTLCETPCHAKWKQRAEALARHRR